VPLPDDPLPMASAATNRSVLRPYGVWLVIAPFNYPLALMGGPTAAALVTGNVVVAKGSPHTALGRHGCSPTACAMPACPPGRLPVAAQRWPRAWAEALAEHPGVAGITFTGSVRSRHGRQLAMHVSRGHWPRPCIAEMGGKNPCIVTEHADLDVAATGIVRSAFGLSGQKCSALSRLYVHEAVADALIERLRAGRRRHVTVGDPTDRRSRTGWAR
jgi:acyl-CoA reductase-like NAD-dependent aldehyde dehydrogenase